MARRLGRGKEEEPRKVAGVKRRGLVVRMGRGAKEVWD